MVSNNNDNNNDNNNNDNNNNDNNNNDNNDNIIIIMIIHLFAGAFQGPQGRLTEHQLSMSMRITDLEGLE